MAVIGGCRDLHTRDGCRHCAVVALLPLEHRCPGEHDVMTNDPDSGELELGFALPSLPSLPDLPPRIATDDSTSRAAELANGGLYLPPISPETIGREMTAGETQTADGGGHGPSESGSTAAPQVDPRYRSAQELGRGGMGVVLTAMDSRLNREVAMKLIRRDRLSDPQVRARFLREAQVHAQLEHPNIVPVHDLVEGSQSGGATYFTMKLVRGRSLAALIRELRVAVLAGHGDASFPLNERLDVFRKICDGIAFSHSRGVIHRDLKPDNIMVGQFGEVQVMDWGLARVRDLPDVPSSPVVGPKAGSTESENASESDSTTVESTTTTSSAVRVTEGASDARSVDGDVMGTPAYMAPEQARGDAALDERADVYALGAILYELLTLRAAFKGGAIFGVLYRVINGDFPRPTDCVADDASLAARHWHVAPELEAIVLKAMAGKPEDRYASASDLRRDVGEFIAGRMVSAARYSAIRRVKRWVLRNRVKVGVALLVLLMGLGAVLAAMVSARRARDTVLGQMRSGLDAATATQQQIAALTARGDYLAGVDVARSFKATHGPALMALQVNAVVRAERPEWVERAAALGPAVNQMQNDLLVVALREVLHSLPHEHLADVNDAMIARATDAWRRFEPWLAHDDLRSRLPVAEVAYWLASVHAAKWNAGASERSAQHQADVAVWVAAAWQAQPDSPAVGRCLLLLADLRLARCESEEDARQLVRQYQTACSMNATADPQVRARGFVGLARASLLLPDPAAAKSAVIALLRVLQPDGSPRANYAPLSDLPDGESAELLHVAADLLMIARRLVEPVGVHGSTERICWMQDGTVCLVTDAGDAWAFRVEQPQTAGATPLRVVPTGHALAEMGGNQLKILAPRGDGIHPVAGFAEPESASTLLVVDPRDASAGKWQVPGDVVRLASGDLDGDGQLDLVMVQSDMDPEGLLLSDRMLVRTISAESARTFSADPATVYAGRQPCIVVSDLDADGTDELVICDSGHLRVHSNGRSPLSVLIGDMAPTVVDSPGGKLIVVCGWQSEVERARRQARGESTSRGPRMFRYADATLHEVPHAAWPTRSADGPLRFSEGFVSLPLDQTRTALIDGITQGGRVVHRWMLHDGNPAAIQHAAVVYTGVACRQVAPGLFATPDGLTRRLTDADLAVLAMQPALPDSDHASHESAEMVLNRMLLWFGQADTVVQNLMGEAASQTAPLAVEANAHRVLLTLQALLEAGQLVKVLRVARNLPRQSRFVEHLLLVVDEVLRQSGNVDAVKPLVDEWADEFRLTAGERQRIRSRQRAISRIISALSSGAIELSGTTTRATHIVRGERVFESGRLCNSWVTNEPAQVQTDTDGWHAVASGRGYEFQSEDRSQVMMPRFSGVPLQLTGDVLRLEMLFRLTALSDGDVPAIGLFPVRSPEVAYPTSLDALTIAALAAGDEQMLATRVGQPLRLQHDWFGPLGIERIILSDAETGELIGAVVREARPVNAAGVFAVVGICGRGASSRCELTIERVVLNGDVWLLHAGDTEFDSMMPDDGTHVMSEIARLQATMQFDAADELIEELANALSEDSEAWQSISGFPLFDSLPAGTARKMANGLVERADYLPDNLLIPMLRRPQDLLDVERWTAVGLAMRTLHPDPSDLRNPDPQREQLEQAEHALAMAWAAVPRAEPAAGRSAVLLATQVAAHAAQTGSTRREAAALQSHLVAVADWLEEVAPLSAEQLQWKLAAMAATGRSAGLLEMLQGAEAGGLSPDALDRAYGIARAAPVLRQLTTWLQERSHAVAANAARRGIAPQELRLARSADNGGAEQPDDLVSGYLEFLRSGDVEQFLPLLPPDERAMVQPGTPAWRVCELLAATMQPGPGTPDTIDVVPWEAGVEVFLTFAWSGSVDESHIAELGQELRIARICGSTGVSRETAIRQIEAGSTQAERDEQDADLRQFLLANPQSLPARRIAGRWYIAAPWGDR